MFLMFLLKQTTQTTRRLPMKPVMMMREKRMGTRRGTILIRMSRSSPSLNTSLERWVWLVWLRRSSRVMLVRLR